MPARRSLCLFVLSSLVLSVAVACGEEAPPPAIDETPIIGMMEVPISHRNDGPIPADALRIEASQSELRLNSVPVYQLDRGRIPEAEVTPEGPTKLRVAIEASPARSRATITFHAMVGYGTLARTVQALVGAGYREIYIAVRPLSPTGAAPTSFSWLQVSSPQVVPGGLTTVDPAAYGGGSRAWSEFTSHWQEAYDACRAGRYIDCDHPPELAADGGFMQLVLWTRGQGMQLRFNRVGGEPVPDPMAAATGPALIDGVTGQPSGVGEEVPPTPDVSGAFAFRADQATTAESPISTLTRPICGSTVCQTVIEADEETPMMRVISLLGAAFPNGSTPPALVFRLPPDR